MGNKFKTILIRIVIVLAIMFFMVFSAASQFDDNVAETNNIDVEYSKEVNEVQNAELIKPNYEPTVTESEVNENQIEHSKLWSADENYMLAKIAMAEAEGCSNEVKQCIVHVILNRVHDNRFPNTIHEVLFQHFGNVYQFTPMVNGRWDRVEPNKDCFDAVNTVAMDSHDISMGALYFESCEDKDNWHSRNLEFLFELDGVRFYK